MRILLLSDRVPPDRGGGAEVAAWQLAEGLAARGHDVHVVATTTGPAREERRSGLPVHLLHSTDSGRFQPWLTIWNPRTVAPLRRLLARLAPDVVHAHVVHNQLSYGSLAVARRLGRPTVFTSHDLTPVAGGKVTADAIGRRRGIQAAAPLSWRYEAGRLRLRFNPCRRALVKAALSRHAGARTCVCEAQRRMLEANGFDGFAVVHNAVDPARFEPADGAPGSRVVLFGGRVSEAKGAVALGRAFRILASRYDDVELVVLSAHERDLALIRTGANADRRVRHGGWRDPAAMADAYRMATVTVLPSLFFECAPLTVLESMAASRPVVASPYGGTPEYLVDGVTGTLAEPEDPRALAAALGSLLEDEPRRAAMGIAGRARVVEHFSLDAHVSRYLDLYASLPVRA